MKSPLTRCVAVTTVALFLLVPAGCGSSGPPLGTVKGKVTLNGEPLEFASVRFQPTAAGGKPSSGYTDAEGNYELRFTKDRNGAMVGTHKVRISTFAQSNDGKAPIPERVPQEYNDQTTLEREVVAGDNTHDFELVGTVK